MILLPLKVLLPFIYKPELAVAVAVTEPPPVVVSEDVLYKLTLLTVIGLLAVKAFAAATPKESCPMLSEVPDVIAPTILPEPSTNNAPELEKLVGIVNAPLLTFRFPAFETDTVGV